MEIIKNIKTENKNFWGFAFLNLTYFSIWCIVAWYLTLWMSEVANLDSGFSGIVFSTMAAASLVLQPFLGMLSDKLLFRKTLILTIAVSAIFIGPYFQWAFIPLLSINKFLVTIFTGIFLGFILNGGSSVVEQYVQRSALANTFEYGHARMGGSVAAMLSTLIAGRLFIWNPYAIFWAGSFCGFIMTLILIFSTKVNLKNAAFVGDTSNSLDMKQILQVFKLKNFWALSLFFMGSAAIYDVVDQQFIVFFRTFFDTPEEATLVYSYVGSFNSILEFILMIPMPYIINKIGAKNGLILAGLVAVARTIGSAFAPNWWMVILFRLLAGLEMPLILVSITKYIAGTFDMRLYATIYALAANFAKQIAVFILSAIAGNLYAVIGFQRAYLFMGMAILVITVITIFILPSEKKVLPDKVVVENS
jgi:MFS transporter, OHS family, lactose permease